MMQILAVGMLDHETFGEDAFFVQTGPNEVAHFMVHKDGHMRMLDRPGPIEMVYSSVEKFNHGYLVEEPVSIDALGELPGYIGKFEITSPTRCRLRAG